MGQFLTDATLLDIQALNFFLDVLLRPPSGLLPRDRSGRVVLQVLEKAVGIARTVPQLGRSRICYHAGALRLVKQGYI